MLVRPPPAPGRNGSARANYWAQLALRNCLTQACNSGTPKGGACTISGSGLNGAGEPNMSLH